MLYAHQEQKYFFFNKNVLQKLVLAERPAPLLTEVLHAMLKFSMSPMT